MTIADVLAGRQRWALEQGDCRDVLKTMLTCPQCGSARQILVPVVERGALAMWETTKKGGYLAHYTCQGCGIFWTKVVG